MNAPTVQGRWFNLPCGHPGCQASARLFIVPGDRVDSWHCTRGHQTVAAPGEHPTFEAGADGQPVRVASE